MQSELTYAFWKKLLRDDCIRHNKIHGFYSLGESFLQVLYENGTDPTVDAIVKDGLNGKDPRKIAA